MKDKTVYKNTSVGLIPSDWEVKKLREIILEAKLGGNYENSESNEGIPVIKMGNIGRGNINISKIQNLPLNEKYNTEDVLKNGDLLFNTRNTLDLVGKVAIWNNEIPFALYNSNLLRLIFKSEFVASNWFMNYSLNSVRSLVQLRGFATGTTSVAAIYGRDLNHLKLPLPSLPEQQKIASILSTWDIAIDNCKGIIDNLKNRNNGLTQQLLTGKTRVKGFEKSKWALVSINRFAKDSSRKNSNDKELIVLSCTKHNGLVPSLEYFGRKIYSDDLTTYKIVSKGQFAYATNHIEEGSIGYQSKYDEALISPMYTVFHTDETVNDNFLFRVLKSTNYVHEYQKRMEGSIDRRGGLRWSEFSKIKVPVPELKEQFSIVEILDKATEELNQYQQKLQTLQLQKKGLMQQLLTGKVRVKTNN